MLGQKGRWTLAGLFLTVLGPVLQAQAAVTYSSVFAFDISTSSGGVVEGSNEMLFGTLTNTSLTYGGAIYKVSLTGGAPQTIYQLSSTDGYLPRARLLVGGDGYLYGSTIYGARQSSRSLSDGTGTLFRLKQDGTGYQKLHTFDSSVSFATVTVGGLSETIFANSDGIFPSYALIEDGTYLYGVTSIGGRNGMGVIFRLLRAGGGFTVLHEFAARNADGSSTEGANPSGPLLISNGRLYGVTSGGGTNLYTVTTTTSTTDTAGVTTTATTVTTQGTGTVFSLNTDGSDFQTIYNFSAFADAVDSDSATFDYLGQNGDGAFPAGGLTEVSPGVLVGTTTDGGITIDTAVGGLGTVFQLNTNGTVGTTTLTKLHDFDVDGGYAPVGKLVLATDGRLYGLNSNGSSTAATVLSYGSVFAMDTTGSNYEVVHPFTITEGVYPEAGLSLASNGDLFGTTTQGGACNSFYGSYGNVFRLSFSGLVSSGYSNCTVFETDDGGGGVMSPGWMWLLAALGLVPLRRRLFSFD
jgi:MYXO-CTERM domain-containing protein